MTTTLATRQNGAVANLVYGDDGIPSQQMMEFCQAIAQSNLVPKDFRGRPADILIAVTMGREVGLKPVQALQSIAVVNGRPSLYGDGALAVVRQRSDCEDVRESIEGNGDDRTATCTIVRAGQTPVTRTFSVLDSKRAKLYDKEGPWKQYPDRMLQMRARGFAMRDAFPDALKGFAIAEEAMDIPADHAATDPPAGAPTRTEQVLQRLRPAVTATVEPAPVQERPAATVSEPHDGGQAQAANESAPSAQFVATAPTSAEEAQLKRELRKAIGLAWNDVAPEKRAAVLEQEYAKKSLTDLTVEQLRCFLEDTPTLIASLS